MFTKRRSEGFSAGGPGLCLPAGQDADHVVGLVPLDADGTVVEVGLRLLVALPDGANLELADGFLCCVAKTTLRGREGRGGMEMRERFSLS